MGGMIEADDVDRWVQRQKEQNLVHAAVAERDVRIKQLERQCGVLAAEVDRQRAWKESAMTLLTRYDNLAETFGGKLGSSKVTNLETGVAALRAEVGRQRPVVDAAVEWRRWGYERKADFCVGISPLLDAIDIYDVGAKRPCEEL